MKIAIVGASGAVGQEFLKILEERDFPIDTLELYGSERSAGKKINFRGEELTVKLLQDNDDFKGTDIAFVSAGGSTSRKFEKTITRHGTLMIDNSSAFRMDTDVPLVVPEVNPEDALEAPRNVIANPNCSTIQMVVAVKAIDRLSKVKRIHVATYQAASGAGQAAMDELSLQYRSIVEGGQPRVEKFQAQLADNLIPQVDVFTDNGYTNEELKMHNETRKILHSEVKVSATCVRVPVLRAHSEAIWVETQSPVSAAQAREAFEATKGITVIDERQAAGYPMPLMAAGTDPVYVGRIREDLTDPNGLTFWCVSDQIRKGAALNAVQIAEYLIGNSSRFAK